MLFHSSSAEEMQLKGSTFYKCPSQDRNQKVGGLQSRVLAKAFPLLGASGLFPAPGMRKAGYHEMGGTISAREVPH